jgi:hypothetical protein
MPQPTENPNPQPPAPETKPEPKSDKPDPGIIPPPLESVNYAEVFDIGATIDFEVELGIEEL